MGGGGGGFLGGALAGGGLIGGLLGGSSGGQNAIGGIGGVIEDRTGIDMGDKSQADRALRAQRQAAAVAEQRQQSMYDQTRADQAPWREAGARALGGMENADFQRDFSMGDFQADPGYQFRMQEGMKALQGSAAARGSLNSGATLKALTKYGQDFASNEYTNAYNRFNSDRDRRFNRLASLAGVGQTATNQMQAANTNFGNSMADLAMGVGNARAASHINQANRFNQFMDNNQQMFMQGAGMLMASDRRLKKNIVKLEKSQFKDVPTYAFEYVDEMLGAGRKVGVMAQDLLALDPKHPAVVETPLGYFVNYSKLERVA